MTNNIEKDLQDCLKLITSDWDMQNNASDKKTNFIYKMSSLSECLEEIEKQKVDQDYALHRWYNYMTSVYSEYIFCDYGAVHDEDIYNHDVDIRINSIPFDVKLTVYPAKLKNHPYDLKTRSGKNAMIQWFYINQSQQARKQLVNRLYIVCDGANSDECLKMKSDFNLLRKQIKAFMEHSFKNGLNHLMITDNGKTTSLYSDIIYISYE